MRSPTEEFVKSEDIDINGDKPTSGVSNQMTEQLSAHLYKEAYERVKEIVDKRERVAKNLKEEEEKIKEVLSKRQPELLLEQYVSSYGNKIVTTASLVQEEVKAQDVLSALKHVSKVSRRNSQAGNSKNVTSLAAAQEKGKGVQQTQPRRKARRRVLAKERRTHPRVEAREKERMEEQMAARREGYQKVKNLRRPGDPVVRQFHGGSNDARPAIAVRLPEHQASHLQLRPCEPLC